MERAQRALNSQLPLHAISEDLVVLPFGVPVEGALINIVGTAIHHTVDLIISIIVLRAARPLLVRQKLKAPLKPDADPASGMLHLRFVERCYETIAL